MRVNKIKKIIAVGAAAAMVGATLSAGAVAAAQPAAINVPHLQIDKTKVVLPTVPEVNGVPLHIKDDAATSVTLVEKIYSDTIYSALEAFNAGLVPVKADKEASNYVTDMDQVVTLASDDTPSYRVIGALITDDNGNPTGVDINFDGTSDYNVIKDDNGIWYIDFDGSNSVTDGDIPVSFTSGLVVTSNISPNGYAADVDTDYHFYIPQIDLPFANSTYELYDPAGHPQDKVYFAIDFSKVHYIDPNATGLSPVEKAHVDSWELQTGAITIAYALEYSPLKPSKDDLVIPSQIQVQNQNINVLYYYKHLYPGDDPNKDVAWDIGKDLTVDKWTFNVKDIDDNDNMADLFIKAPNGQTKEIFVHIGDKMVLTWIDKNGDFQYDVGDAGTILDEWVGLLQDGITSMATYMVHDPFIGINDTQKIMVNLDVYDLKKMYKDGEKLSDIVPAFADTPYADNWYLTIDVTNPNEPIVKFTWKTDYSGDNKYPPVFLKPGQSFEIPIPFFKKVEATAQQNSEGEPQYVLDERQIDISFSANKNNDGYYDPATAKWFAYYFKDNDQYYSRKNVDGAYNLLDKKIKSLDPSEAIITDQDLLAQGFQPGFDYVIIGGWVSNAAWQLLDQYYPDDVTKMKNKLMDDLSQGQPGFVLDVLPNPADPNTVVIVAAGTDHEQTREAVEALMAALG